MKKFPLIFISIFALVSCADKTVARSAAPAVAKAEPKVLSTQKGEASWYEIKCNGGTHTASGEPLKDYAMTAAHKTLPMGTKVRVTNVDNGTSVIVRITDRGPYTKGRIIDVTKGVAEKLGFKKRGLVDCKVEVLEKH